MRPDLGEVRVVGDVASAFAAELLDAPPARLFLSGGGTARRCYLAVDGDHLASTAIFFGDERWVPVDHEDSNERLARKALLDRLPHGPVHSMRSAGSVPEEAAAAYDGLLRGLPDLGLVHLGLGPDGHTASLFPGSPALAESERLVVATGDDPHPHPRLTITLPAIARAERVVVTVAGAEKAGAWRRVVAGDDVPAASIRASRVLWLVDPAANAGTVPTT